MTIEELKDLTLVEIEGNWITFYLPFEITKDEAFEIQAELSYHPAGYGFYDFNVNEETSWRCSRSCD
jgi:hypothetical protein